MSSREAIHPVVEIPEPLATDLASGRPEAALDHPVTTPAARFGRALALRQLGRNAEALSAFTALEPELGLVATLEAARTRIPLRRYLEEDRIRCDAIYEEAPADSALQGVAAHVTGHLLGLLRRTTAAARLLRRAADIFETLTLPLARAQVEDTLGQIYAAGGHLEYALAAFATSLAEKALHGDRYGMAISLGNLGRTHLRSGRLREAAHCLERDLVLARQLGDARGEARALQDLGRIHLEKDEREAALKTLDACRRASHDAGFEDLEILALKELARLAARRGQGEEALRLVDRAATIAGNDASDLAWIVRATRALIRSAADHEGAAEDLEAAAAWCRRAELPDFEIEILIALARHQVRRRRGPEAAAAISTALARARADAHLRYLPRLREVWNELSLIEVADLSEADRLHVARGGAPLSPDGYFLEQRLGRGSFGEVWRAHDPRTGRTVAIKVFELSGTLPPATREGLIRSARRELEAAGAVHHGSVARVYAFGRDSRDRPYVVQDFIEGPSLLDVMHRRRARSLASQLRTLQQIASALEALHRAGVIHRDLKPANVMMYADDGPPVLIDFGLALMTDDEGPTRGAGTLAYMAPEQARGHSLTGAADVHALGVIAFEWFSGRRPLDLPREGDAARMECVAKTVRRSLAKEMPELDAELAKLVDSMLAMDPADRPSPSHLVQALGRLRDRLPFAQLEDTHPLGLSMSAFSGDLSLEIFDDFLESSGEGLAGSDED